MLACLSLCVVVRALLRRRQPTQLQHRRRGVAVVDTTQRLGVFGFAQCNVIYDFYQKEANLHQKDVNALETRWRTHRPSVGAFGHGHATRLSLGQMPWRETFKCDALQPILTKGLPNLGLAAFLDYHDWNPTWTSALGWSVLQITSSDPRAPSALHVGQYGSVIALNEPIPRATMGTGLQWTYERNLWSSSLANGECMQNDARIRLFKTLSTR